MVGTIQLAQRSGEEPATITMEISECVRFAEAVNRLVPGKVYLYEEAGGTKIVVRFLGFEGLNAAFEKCDDPGVTPRRWEPYLAPAVDIGDGSLFTDWLTGA